MRTIKLVVVVLCSIVIASCGGSGGGSGTVTAKVTLIGTVATSSTIPMGNVPIAIHDSVGNSKSGTTLSDGKYDVEVTGMTAPFLLRVPAGTGYLYSVATATGIANIHPFTDLIIRNWYKVQGSDVETAFSTSGALPNVPTVAGINTIERVVRNILSTWLTKEGLTASTFNLLNSSFNADNTGFDKVLDNTGVVIGATGNVTVTTADPITGIEATMVTTTLATDLTIADTTKPTDPSGLAAIPASTTSIVLVWNASTDNIGVAGYNIYRGGSKVAISPYPVYSDTGLTSSSYCYQVEAFDGTGNVSAKSSSVCATPTPAADTAAPSAPTSLIATAVSASQINLTWAASTDNVGVAGYSIYRDGVKVAAVSGIIYSDTGLSSGTLYSYTVKALDGALNNSVDSNTASATTQAGIPAAPTGVTATAGDGQTTINWAAVSSATSYNVYWSTTSVVTKASGAKLAGATSPYSHTGRTNATTYYYIVTAVNSSGESVESTQVSATTQAGSTVPLTLAATELSDITAKLNGSFSNPSGYSTAAWFEYGTTTSYGNSTTPSTYGTSGTIPFYTNIAGLQQSTTYHFRLVTQNAGGTFYGSDNTFVSLKTITTLASASFIADCIAVDSSSAYWVDSGPVNKVDISGGVVTTLNPPPRELSACLALDSSNVYWVDGGGVRKVGLSGGTITTLAPRGTSSTWTIGGMAVDSKSVYWLENGTYTNNVYNKDATLNKVSINGGAVTVLATGGLDNIPQGMTTDSSSIYWADRDRLLKINKDGTGLTVFASGINNHGGIVADSTSLYWADWNSNLNKISINGGVITAIVGDIHPYSDSHSMAVDSSGIYWIGACTGSSTCVQRVNINGGVVTTLASANTTFSSTSITVDSTNVYWTAGAVLKISK